MPFEPSSSASNPKSFFALSDAEAVRVAEELEEATTRGRVERQSAGEKRAAEVKAATSVNAEALARLTSPRYKCLRVHIPFLQNQELTHQQPKRKARRAASVASQGTKSSSQLIAEIAEDPEQSSDVWGAYDLLEEDLNVRNVRFDPNQVGVTVLQLARIVDLQDEPHFYDAARQLWAEMTDETGIVVRWRPLTPDSALLDVRTRRLLFPHLDQNEMATPEASQSWWQVEIEITAVQYLLTYDPKRPARSAVFLDELKGKQKQKLLEPIFAILLDQFLVRHGLCERAFVTRHSSVDSVQCPAWLRLASDAQLGSRFHEMLRASGARAVSTSTNSEDATKVVPQQFVLPLNLRAA